VEDCMEKKRQTKYQSEVCIWTRMHKVGMNMVCKGIIVTLTKQRRINISWVVRYRELVSEIQVLFLFH
jgi:hypothetical protein